MIVCCDVLWCFAVRLDDRSNRLTIPCSRAAMYRTDIPASAIATRNTILNYSSTTQQHLNKAAAPYYLLFYNATVTTALLPRKYSTKQLLFYHTTTFIPLPFATSVGCCQAHNHHMYAYHKVPILGQTTVVITTLLSPSPILSFPVEWLIYYGITHREGILFVVTMYLALHTGRGYYSSSPCIWQINHFKKRGIMNQILM